MKGSGRSVLKVESPFGFDPIRSDQTVTTEQTDKLEMEEVGSSYERPRVLGPTSTLRHVQEGVERIENAREHGIDVINRRKDEIFEKATSQNNALGRIEAAQDRVKIVGAIAGICIVFLLAYELSKSGLSLIRRAFHDISAKRRKFNTGKEFQSDSLGDEFIQHSTRQRPVRRSHSRQWRISNSPM